MDAVVEMPSTADLASADDGALVEAFVAGRTEAFDLIVERHRRHVYQVCYRFVGNHEDASDLAQDVFVRAFKGLQRFKGQSSLGTWLYRVAVNASSQPGRGAAARASSRSTVGASGWPCRDPLMESRRG